MDAIQEVLSVTIPEQKKSSDVPTYGIPGDKIFSFTFFQQNEQNAQAIITLDKDVVSSFISLTLHNQQKILRPTGVNLNMLSHEFIKQQYEKVILKHLKEFFLKFCVIDFLYYQLSLQKINIGGSPRLTSCSFDFDGTAQYTFDLTTIAPIPIGEWKLFPFKTPKRKNYKDLDRQVETFIGEEQTTFKTQQNDIVCLHDWILFSITLLKENDEPMSTPLTNFFWFKVSDEEIESPLKELFLHKKINEKIITNNSDLQTFFSHSLTSSYTFEIFILDIVSHASVCFNQLKHFFKIKTQRDLHKKLIEIFSFRNDISQRKAIVEEALKTLLQKHTFTIPPHLVLRQQESILSCIRQNTDYNVYKRQADFEQSIRQLAKKQAYEMVIIDQLAAHEKLEVSVADIKGYLNLTKRARLKDFLYFEQPQTEIDGQQVPISMEQLKTYCLREKTINYLIYHLTKN